MPRRPEGSRPAEPQRTLSIEEQARILHLGERIEALNALIRREKDPEKKKMFEERRAKLKAEYEEAVKEKPEPPVEAKENPSKRFIGQAEATAQKIGDEALRNKAFALIAASKVGAESFDDAISYARSIERTGDPGVYLAIISAISARISLLEGKDEQGKLMDSLARVFEESQRFDQKEHEQIEAELVKAETKFSGFDYNQVVNSTYIMNDRRLRYDTQREIIYALASQNRMEQVNAIMNELPEGYERAIAAANVARIVPSKNSFSYDYTIFERAKEKSSDHRKDSELFLQLVKAALARNDIDGAIKALAQIPDHPELTEARMDIAVKYAELGDMDKAFVRANDLVVSLEVQALIRMIDVWPGEREKDEIFRRVASIVAVRADNRDKAHLDPMVATAAHRLGKDTAPWLLSAHNHIEEFTSDPEEGKEFYRSYLALAEAEAECGVDPIASFSRARQLIRRLPENPGPGSDETSNSAGLLDMVRSFLAVAEKITDRNKQK